MQNWKKVTWKPQAQIDHTLLLESFEQMYSSVKNSRQRDIGVYSVQPWAITLHTKGAGQEAGSIEAQAQATDILYCDQVFTKKYIVFNK